jgi:hypothetical protein
MAQKLYHFTSYMLCIATGVEARGRRRRASDDDDVHDDGQRARRRRMCGGAARSGHNESGAQGGQSLSGLGFALTI